MAHVISLSQYLQRGRMGLFDDEPDDGGGGGGSATQGVYVGGDGSGYYMPRADKEIGRLYCEGQGGTYNEATDRCEFEEDKPTTGYGPSPADCAAVGAIYDAASGQCIAKTPQAGGSQFVEYTGAETPAQLPPWVAAGIAKCGEEGKGYDAASDSCYDCPDGTSLDEESGQCVKDETACPDGQYWDVATSRCVKDETGGTPRGGGGGGGHAKAAEKTSGSSSSPTRGLVGALVGAAAGAAVGAGAGQLTMKRPGVGAGLGGVVGAFLGGIVGTMADGS